MKTYSVDEISQIVGGMLTKVNDVQIEKLMPPHKADEKSLALGLSEDAIEALYHTKAKNIIAPTQTSDLYNCEIRMYIVLNC